MLSILHVIPSLDQRDGGILRVVLNLSADSRRKGIHSEIIGLGDIAITDNPVPLELMHTVPQTFPTAYGYSSALRPWLRQNLPRFDGLVLHGMWQYPEWAAARECVRAKVPYVCFPHGMLDRWPVRGQGRLKEIKKSLYWHLREQWIYNRSADVYFTTAREKRAAEETFKLPPRGRVVIPCGIRTDAGSVDRPANANLLQPAGRRVALFLGRVHPKKNVGLAIRAWKIAGLPDDWHLIIAGSGDIGYIESLQRMCREFHLERNVHFVGHVAADDKSYLLGRADWFLLPSLQENFGVAVLEAIQARCAVVISDQVYIGEFLRPESEILPLDETAWVNFMRDRMVDDNWRREVSTRDYRQIARIMNEEAVLDGWRQALMASFMPTGETVEAEIAG